MEEGSVYLNASTYTGHCELQKERGHTSKPRTGFDIGRPLLSAICLVNCL
jgi:hypothetical protein